ncbi:hypothetical protein [Nocardia carnea]|uniref:hypothetical protein n=1 Tax=Nocardia carnea TaxID=37328 RepID=UPI0024546C1F|nr:hypothetical protein [Nocardia carnea]
MQEELPLLRAISLKRRLRRDELPAGTGLDESTVDAVLRVAVESGNVELVRDRLSLTATGRERLAELLDAERVGLDSEGLLAAYHDFGEHNSAFKQLVTDWQLIGGTQPNDHTDAEYDAAIIDRLAELHDRFDPLLQRIAALAPRVGLYRSRFAVALQRVQAGDHSWLAHPLGDSYHTVWFELHEDLISLCGLTRKAEAEAGRAG